MIPFIDLKTQQQRIRQQIEQAIIKVLDHGQYIMGPEIDELESQLAQRTQRKHAISCANGTDALALVLMALDIKAGDAIFVPSFTFAATAEVVAWLGATPVFVDIDPATFNMCPQSLTQAIQLAKYLQLSPKGVVPVDLFGQPADYNQLIPIAQSEGLWVMADTAQGLGGQYHDQPAGSLGLVATTSFFPAKPLGCYGEGGAIFTNDDQLAHVIRSLRIHGQGEHKYDNVRIGMNGRLETIQAAILLEKLKIFDDELARRNEIAAYYTQGLEEILATAPTLLNHTISSWAQYTVMLPQGCDRDAVVKAMAADGIPTMIYYAKGLHDQIAYGHYPRAHMSATENASHHVLSLPMHPYLTTETQDLIIASLKQALAQQTFKMAS